MANTYTQIHIQFVFAVKHRRALIESNWKNELYKYITGIIQNNQHKVIIINGVEDHIHILVGLRPTQSISDLLKEIKGSSSKWINERGFTKMRFEWQEGYGAFSYGLSSLKNVIRYIENQEQHHAKQNFIAEYIDMLHENNIAFDERYIFKDLL